MLGLKLISLSLLFQKTVIEKRGWEGWRPHNKLPHIHTLLNSHMKIYTQPNSHCYNFIITSQSTFCYTSLLWIFFFFFQIFYSFFLFTIVFWPPLPYKTISSANFRASFQTVSGFVSRPHQLHAKCCYRD